MTLYEQASSGQPQVVLLEGEAGIGKTRLATAFLDLGEGAGAVVLEARAFKSYQSTCHINHSSSLCDTTLRTGTDLRQTPRVPWLAELSRLLPDLRDTLP